MRVKKINGKLYQVETETQEIISDKYKTRFFIEFLQEFGLDEEFYRCKTEDERYDIYALYTRVGLSKVHPPEYFKRNKVNIDSGVFTSKPNNKDNATFAKKPKKEKPKEEEPKEEKPKETVEKEPQKEQKKGKESYTNIQIEGSEYLDSDKYYAIQQALGKLPKKIKDFCIEQKYRIKVVPNSAVGYEYAGECAYSDKIIRLALDVSNNYGDTLMHEFGHMIDRINYQYNSDTSKFRNIYNKEKVHLLYDSKYEYLTKDPQEYFAQSFSEYVLNPYQLKTTAPKTYEFMKNYIDTL